MAVACKVTGTLNPDVTGEYLFAGMYNMNAYFKHETQDMYVWYQSSLTMWVISDTLGDITTSWRSIIDEFEADYTPFGVSGIATVALIVPEVIRPSAESQLSLTDNATLDFTPDQIHADWVRWCYASINKHFDDRKENYELYIEGDERTLQDEVEFAELRIDGPFITNSHKHRYLLDVEINVLCQTHLDPRKHYAAQVMVGVFARAFRNLIPVYKYGDGPLDDGTLLECFHLTKDLRNTIAISHFGIIKNDVKITQTTIEGHYRLELWSKGD